MIFKVSFKETEKNPCKAVEKVGKTTTVILKGVVDLPSFWKHIPDEVVDFIGNTTKIEAYENIVDNYLLIYSKGVAKCRPDDKYNSLLGERLAEARAKYDIYKFFYNLTHKLYDYYDKILFGESGVVDTGYGSCLAKVVKKYEGLCIREAHHIGELLASKDNG